MQYITNVTKKNYHEEHFYGRFCVSSEFEFKKRLTLKKVHLINSSEQWERVGASVVIILVKAVFLLTKIIL